MEHNDFIEKKLKELNLSWFKLGEYLNIPNRTIYRWKNRKTKVSKVYFEKVRDYLIEQVILKKGYEKEL